MDSKIRFGALWKQTDKNGNEYLAGSINQQTRVMIFPNSYKDQEKQPDFILYLAPNEKKEPGSDG